jgi:hypothetical protein
MLFVFVPSEKQRIQFIGMPAGMSGLESLMLGPLATKTALTDYILQPLDAELSDFMAKLHAGYSSSARYFIHAKIQLPMSHIYRISPQQAEVERKKSLMRSLTFGAVLFVGVVLFTPAMTDTDSRSILLSIVMIGGLLAFLIFRQISRSNRSVSKVIESFELEVNEGGITRRYADAPTVSIGFNEVTAMEQRAGQGTIIKTAQPNRFVWVPCTLDEYGSVVEMVAQRSGAARKVQNYSWSRMYSLAVIFGIGWLVLINAHERRLVLTLSATLAIGLLWCLVIIWRNPNVSRKLKLSMLFGLVPLLALIGRFYQAW